MLSKICNLFSNPFLIIPILGQRGFFHGVPDERYLRRCFKAFLGYDLDLDNPKTFNEKLQWLKLHDRNPLYITLVDKYEVKKWVASLIGEEHIVPTLGVWESLDEIDFNALPDRYVLKCTHDSGGLAICRDRATFNVCAARRKIGRSLSRNYYWSGREWPYRDVKPRIIAEEYLDAGNGVADLVDYKFYCFGGEPRFLYVSQGLEHHETARISFLNIDWTFAPYARADYKPFDELPACPSRYEEMLVLSRKLAAGIPFVRVDLYESSGRVFFSEMTFSPNAGFCPFDPVDADRAIGEMIQLPYAN